MTEAKIKEEIATYFFATMAARMGYGTTLPRIDEGVDLILQSSIEFPSKYKNLRVSTGKWLAVQLKTTTKKQTVEEDNFLKFDLKVKNYDDLIFRKNQWHQFKRDIAPMVLILMVLPDDKNKWFEVDTNQQKYTVNGIFYWYFPSKEDVLTKNVSKQRISIPIENKIDLLFFDKIFNLFFK